MALDVGYKSMKENLCFYFPGGKWPSIRVASLDTLRGNELPTTAVPSPASPSALMRTRPDLTIVAAKKSIPEDEEQS